MTASPPFEFLNLDRLSPRRFLGFPGPGIAGRTFGGHAMAQALMAASLVEAKDPAARRANSFHACFLAPGQQDEPVDYEVDRIGGGRAFAIYRVNARQGRQDILTLIANFHRAEPGLAHQDTPPALPSPEAAVAAYRAWQKCADPALAGERARRIAGFPVEVIPVDPDRLFEADNNPPSAAWWIKARAPTVLDPAQSRALLAYVSDLMLLRAAMLPHAILPGMPGVQVASLDHALWFHETPDFDDWIEVQIDSHWAGNARGLNRGYYRDRNGTLIASVVQESLMRVRPPAQPQGSAKSPRTSDEA